MDELLRKLENPPVEYRSLPFWSWNDTLEPERLEWQMEEMQKAGAGGFFMHARGGLKTDYLQDSWFGCIQTCIEKAKENGLQAWVYDEEGWPSGFSGGLVTAMGDDYHARGIDIRFLDWKQIRRTERVLGVFAYQNGMRTIVPEKEMVPGETYDGFLVIEESVCPYYIDVLNPKVIRAFLETTHEEYVRRLGEDFKYLKGFFTDEPRMSEGPVPWSKLLPDAFRERFGYDLLRCLPALFLPCEEHEKVRHDFWSLANGMFVDAYMKQIGQWCDDHGCRLTGHMMMEESLYSQMTGTGGNMPFYQYMSMPGVDSLRRNINDPRIPKQVSSVAEQLGKEFVISESYGMSGWDMNFEEMRWIAGWQFVNGVNIICQHLQAYSLKGLRKRDYPPSLFYQQTWWAEYRRFTDYLARLTVLMTEGEKLVDVLLIHPMHSGWISYDGKNNAVLKKLDEDFIRACETLSGLHTDYHLGDEDIMKKHASVRGNTLHVGGFGYKAVILPSMLTIDRFTLELLLDFAAKGGILLSFGKFPTLCEGRKEDLTQLQSVTRTAGSPEALLQMLRPALQAPVSIREDGGEIFDIACCQRQVGKERLLYLTNNSRLNTHQAVITLPGTRRVEELLLETAGAKNVLVSHQGGHTVFTVTVLPMQSRVFRSAEGQKSGAVDAPFSSAVSVQAGSWKLESAEPNALTLDCCEYRIDEGEWQPKTAVIHLMKQLMGRRQNCAIEMRFSFELDMEPSEAGEVCLVMEQPEQFEITVNGTSVSHVEEGYYKDISFKRLKVASALVRGRNEILVKGRFFQSPHVYETLFGQGVYETEINKLTYDTELESLYLIGDFGVYAKEPMQPGERQGLWSKPEFILREQPKALENGDFTQQGFAFFSGRMKVSKTLNLQKLPGGRILLELGHPRAHMVKLFVNGKEQKTFLWAPYVCDITDSVTDGENTLLVELYSGNRNLLGPHHNIQGEMHSVGPQSFEGKYSWTDRPTEAVDIDRSRTYQSHWTEDYSFVTFGL